MKLSKAMREGAKLVPQGVGDYFRRNALDEVVCACAMGAAILAEMGTAAVNDHDYYGPCRYWPELREVKAAHPVTGEINLVNDIVYGLNDLHRWTREQIADWLKEIGL